MPILMPMLLPRRTPCSVRVCVSISIFKGGWVGHGRGEGGHITIQHKSPSGDKEQ